MRVIVPLLLRGCRFKRDVSPVIIIIIGHVASCETLMRRRLSDDHGAEGMLPHHDLYATRLSPGVEGIQSRVWFRRGSTKQFLILQM